MAIVFPHLVIPRKGRTVHCAHWLVAFATCLLAPRCCVEIYWPLVRV